MMHSLEKNTLLTSTTKALVPSLCKHKQRRRIISSHHYQVLVLATPGFIPAVTAASLRALNISIQFVSTLDQAIRAFAEHKFYVCVVFDDGNTFDTHHITKLISSVAPLSNLMRKLIVFPVENAISSESKPAFHLPINFLPANFRPQAITKSVVDAVRVADSDRRISVRGIYQ